MNKFKYAIEGIKYTYLTQSSFRIMVWMSAITFTLGYIYRCSLEEWIVLLFCMFFTLSAELCNTALEQVCNIFTQGWLLNEVKIVKDVSAGAVFLLSICSAIVGLIIFIPKFL